MKMCCSWAWSICSFPSMPWLALLMTLATFLFEIFIDMNYARFKWQLTFLSSWLFTAVAGVSNIIVLI